MLVSIKKLSFIHLFASEFAASVDVAETTHQSAIGLDVTLAGRVGFEPFAEGRVECFAFGLGNLASPFNEIGVCAEGDVFHTIPVCTILV